MKDSDWQRCTLCADSRDVIRRIPDNAIDFILTDPPYNLGKHSTGNIPLPGRTAINNDVAEWDMEEFNPEEWVDEFIRILKPTGNIFIFTSYNHLGRWYNCLDHRFDTTNFMIWHKTNPAPKIFKAGFLNSCEMIFTCWNKGHTWNFISQAEMHNFIETSICMRPERLNSPKHPAQKPVKILRKMIQIASNPGDIVFDPFMGVGSTGVAALELGRKFIGVEKSREYYMAAKKRIDDTFSKVAESKNDLVACASDDLQKPNPTGLPPIVKWPGGKEKELDYIIPNAPAFNRFIDPFVGGGSVFMGITANEYLVNDLSEELITLYRNIADGNKDFYDYCYAIDNTWWNTEIFFVSHPELLDIYGKYQKGEISKTLLKDIIADFCQHENSAIANILAPEFGEQKSILKEELEKNLSRKLLRMRELEQTKHPLPTQDIKDNILTAIKSAVYMNFRNLYNDRDISLFKPALHCALFFFIRNYAYSGMFRYSSRGEFNVPYGGIAYNTKKLQKKLEYYRTDPVQAHFGKTNIFNLDFEEFLRQVEPCRDDFLFLDPPYDSEFSTYAQNPFTKADQERLASYLINDCASKWMVIIKNTDFIYNLYNHPGINIRMFDKKYLVSFMNRNNKDVTHLLITNY